MKRALVALLHREPFANELHNYLPGSPGAMCRVQSEVVAGKTC
jgi:hypothetical protein